MRLNVSRSDALNSDSPDSWCVFDDARKRRSLAELEGRVNAVGFWDDPQAAQTTMKRLADLRADLERVDTVRRLLADATESLDVFGDEPGLEEEVDGLIARADNALDQLETAASFDQPYDDHGAIVTIHAGAGGTDAADWVAILGRMYLRWAERVGLSTSLVEESPGDEAGLKSLTFFVRGTHAYGWLESERGVHRLVRISPFDAAHRRHTSFASVDLVPEIAEEEDGVEIRPEDIRVETFKAGGAGGQYVNKTESAIRIVHIPTNTIVASQQERSQMQNREVAMRILRARLTALAVAERERELANLRGERRANEWGSQIRSYVLNPYTLVKDHRTNVETSNVDGVLDGVGLEPFLRGYLQQRRSLQLGLEVVS